jgi:hypothetical protein
VVIGWQNSPYNPISTSALAALKLSVWWVFALFEVIKS